MPPPTCLTGPNPITPLPVMTTTWFPQTTKKWLEFTAKYIPGASPVEETTITTEKVEELTIHVDTPSTPTQQQQPTPVWPLNMSKLTMLQLVGVIVVSSFFIIGLYFDGHACMARGNKIPLHVSCSATAWEGVMQCGLDGVSCRPFNTYGAWQGIQCDANCASTVVSPSLPYSTNRVIGTDTYSALSTLCAAAVHAGVVDDSIGGNFEITLTGPAPNFVSSTRNGITSTSFGWFPKAVQFRAAPSQFCVRARWASILTGIFATFVFCCVLRLSGFPLYFAASQIGLYYCGMTIGAPGNGFFDRINLLAPKEYVIIPMIFTLWYGLSTNPRLVPECRKFPFDVFLFFFAPFWLVIHIDDFDRLGVNFTFTSSGTRNLTMGSIVVFAVIAVLGVPSIILQSISYWRAGLVPTVLVGFVILLSYFLFLGLGDPVDLSFHFHHYFFGLVMIALCRGQRPHSLILQGVGLALFVNGVALYDPDPMFDQNLGDAVTGQTSLAGYITGPIASEPTDPPVWTGVEIMADDTLLLTWALPRDLYRLNVSCGTSIAQLVPQLLYYQYLLDSNVTYVPDPTSPSPPSQPGMYDGIVSPGNMLQHDALAGTVQTDQFRYIMVQNQILVGQGYLRGSYNAMGNWTAQFANNPVTPAAFHVAAFMGGTETGLNSPSLPVPLVDIPNFRNFGDARYGYYYNASDAMTLCGRIGGIYTRLKLLQTGSLGNEWYAT